MQRFYSLKYEKMIIKILHILNMIPFNQITNAESNCDLSSLNISRITSYAHITKYIRLYTKNRGVVPVKQIRIFDVVAITQVQVTQDQTGQQVQFHLPP